MQGLPEAELQRARDTVARFDGRCQCCGGTQEGLGAGAGKDFALDHNHQAKKFRGIICAACNLTIGHAKECVLRLGSIIKYLGGNSKMRKMILAPLPKGMEDTPEIRQRLQAYVEGRCSLPPRGWFCKREGGHDGPCAAYASRWRWGVIFRLASFWVGVHYSEKMQRWCVNLLPCVTLWVAKPGGTTPNGPDYGHNWEFKTLLTKASR
jgi:hypothetical protein